jgi:hypothetical protein
MTRQDPHWEWRNAFQPFLMRFDRQREYQPQGGCRLGKIRTTWVWRLISWFNRSGLN